jgi:hypothetical protein
MGPGEDQQELYKQSITYLTPAGRGNGQLLYKIISQQQYIDTYGKPVYFDNDVEQPDLQQTVIGILGLEDAIIQPGALRAIRKVTDNGQDSNGRVFTLIHPIRSGENISQLEHCPEGTDDIHAWAEKYGTGEVYQDDTSPLQLDLVDDPVHTVKTASHAFTITWQDNQGTKRHAVIELLTQKSLPITLVTEGIMNGEFDEDTEVTEEEKMKERQAKLKELVVALIMTSAQRF